MNGRSEKIRRDSDVEGNQLSGVREKKTSEREKERERERERVHL